MRMYYVQHSEFDIMKESSNTYIKLKTKTKRSKTTQIYRCADIESRAVHVGGNLLKPLKWQK